MKKDTKDVVVEIAAMAALVAIAGVFVFSGDKLAGEIGFLWAGLVFAGLVAIIVIIAVLWRDLWGK